MIYDLILFFIGAYLGYFIHKTLQRYVMYYPQYEDHFAVLQIILISLIIRQVSVTMKSNAPMFNIGFLSTQTLLVKKFFT
jgi:hypothetical protein